MIVNHLARMHEPLLAQVIATGRWRPGHLYAWLRAPKEMRAADVPIPHAADLANEAVRLGDAFVARVVCELAEDAVYTRTRRNAVPANTEELLQPFEILLASPRITSEEKIYIRHHKAKALKRLGRHAEAVGILEDIVQECERGAPAVVRLLLARILTELPRNVSIADATPRARSLLLELLDEAKSGALTVSESVSLAIAELMRRERSGIDVAAVLPSIAALFERLIIRAAQRGLVQGPLAFGALARKWREVDGEAFWRIFETLPLPAGSSQALDADERSAMAAWGDIMIAAAEHDPHRAREFREAAVEFFKTEGSGYGLTRAADLLTGLGRAEEAIALMEQILVGELKPVDRAWAYRRLAAAHVARGNYVKAREAAELALQSLPPDHAKLEDFRRYTDEVAQRR